MYPYTAHIVCFQTAYSVTLFIKSEISWPSVYSTAPSGVVDQPINSYPSRVNVFCDNITVSPYSISVGGISPSPPLALYVIVYVILSHSAVILITSLPDAVAMIAVLRFVSGWNIPSSQNV